MGITAVVWYSTISSRKVPDVVAYSAAISASALGAQWEDAIALCADLWTGRLSPDVPWASKIGAIYIYIYIILYYIHTHTHTLYIGLFEADISVLNHHFFFDLLIS